MHVVHFGSSLPKLLAVEGGVLPDDKGTTRAGEVPTSFPCSTR